jgi:hypothetical protein
MSWRSQGVKQAQQGLARHRVRKVLVGSTQELVVLGPGLPREGGFITGTRTAREIPPMDLKITFPMRIICLRRRIRGRFMGHSA